MDHGIKQLKEYMQATIEIYQDMELSREEVRSEFKAYVDALNSLESHYYGGPVTKLEAVLNSFEKGAYKMACSTCGCELKYKYFRFGSEEYCSRFCSYVDYEGFFSKEEMNRQLIEITIAPNK